MRQTKRASVGLVLSRKLTTPGDMYTEAIASVSKSERVAVDANKRGMMFASSSLQATKVFVDCVRGRGAMRNTKKAQWEDCKK